MTAIDQTTLLTDQQMIDFVINGYIIVQPTVAPSVHEAVCREFDANGTIPVDLQNDPLGLAILEKAPSLQMVFDDPVIRGAAASLLGPDYFVFGRYCHALYANTGGVGWHQDDVNVRHYQVRRLMFLYYPQTVTADMGPTYVVPGTQYFNTPTDRMQNFGNIKGQVALTVPAGSVAITHYDIWHSASHNSSDRTRYLIKYYADRTSEPTRPNWHHDPATAIPLAMNRMHHECTAWAPSEYYKERHLRWRVWSYLLGRDEPVVWSDWNRLHPPIRPMKDVSPDQVQGYVGALMA